MGFLTPWFLAGVAAVGLPVWLHLLRKHKTTPLPFSSLMFFEKRTQSSIKHRRLRYLLLFAARTALILLLVLAFAQPFVRRSVLPSSRTGEIAVVAIDDSLSMRAGNRLETAKQQARSVIGSLGPGQRGQVLAFGQRIQVMTEVTDDHSALNAGIAAIEVTDARTSYAELARSLRSIAQSLKLPLARASLLRHAAERHAAQFQRPAAERGVAPRTPSGRRRPRLPTSRWKMWWCRAASTAVSPPACS